MVRSGEQRYLVGAEQTFDELSLGISDRLAIVVGREPNKQMRIGKITVLRIQTLFLAHSR